MRFALALWALGCLVQSCSSETVTYCDSGSCPEVTATCDVGEPWPAGDAEAALDTAPVDSAMTDGDEPGLDVVPDAPETPTCEGDVPEALPPSFVRVVGRDLVDEHGRKVVLRGINISAGPPEATPENLDSFAIFGFNAIRVVLSWGYLEPSPDVIDEEQFALIDDVVAAAEERGLYLVLDMHQGFWSAYAFPEWTCEEPPDGLDLDATMKCAEGFFGSEELVGQFHDIWRTVAERYRDRAVVVAYDLFNEPPPPNMGDGISGVFERDVLYPFYEELISTVRSVDDRHVVMVEPNFFHSPLVTGFPGPFSDPNLVYAPHIYPLHEYTPGVGWHYMFDPEPGALENAVKHVVETAERLEAPLYIGEWGVIGDDPDSVAWLSAMVDDLERLNLSSTIWTRGGGGGAFAVYGEDGQPNSPYGELLLRPFVHAIAARSFSFHSQPWTGQFELEMEVGPEDTCVTTEVVVPVALGASQLDYEVSGGAATLRYDRDTQRLLILPHCAGCSLTITARF